MLAYDRGWAALNRLLRTGKSFSGRERNCCFLNLGGGRFADVSAASGLDLIHDGRSLALADWDFDGDEDFFIASRTAPRVTFLRNDVATGNHFLALRLLGTTVNRDAIGARVELYRDGDERPIIKTLYAGNGYLGQSSKWLHFGLGADVSPRKVVVRWPDGKTVETFGELASDHRYVLRQGSARAEPWQPPRPALVLPTDPVPAIDRSDSSRVVVLRPARLPGISVLGDDGVTATLDLTSRGKPTVVNVWATWCKPCLVEMKAWGEAKSRFAEAGLDVVALCVDDPTEDRTADLAKAKAAAERLGFPFTVALPDKSAVVALDAVQRAFSGAQRPLPVPASFLVDAEGRIAAIYRGPVEVEQLLADVKICGGGSAEIVAAAVPFPGPWHDPPEPTAATTVAWEFIQAGQAGLAERYLADLSSIYEAGLARAEGDRERWRASSQLAGVLETLGRLAFDRKDAQEAAAKYLRSLELAPKQRHVHLELARTYAALGEKQKVAEQIDAALAIKRDDPENLVRLAMLKTELGDPNAGALLLRESLAIQPNASDYALLARALLAAGQSSDAVDAFRHALELRPNWPPAMNDLAWVLATSADAASRNGEQAVALAEKLSAMSDTESPSRLDTLAAAYAETGRFDDAVAAAEKALRMAEESGNAALAERLTNRLEGYRAKQPYRDAPK